MNRIGFPIIIFLCIIFITGCGGDWGGFLKMKEEPPPAQQRGDPLARVNDKYLYADDIQGIINSRASRQDTSYILHRYIRNWVNKQLMIEEAASQIEFNMAEIERKVLDYRYALMVHEFEKYYVNEQVNRNVTESEIREYYNVNKKNFELKHSIIQGIYAKIPKEAPNTGSFRSMMRRDISNQSREEIKSYCFRFAADYSLEDSLWLNFEEVVQNTPWVNEEDREEILQKDNLVETSDENFLYFLKISDYRGSNEISPLPFVRDDIKKIILNQRKNKITEELKEEILKNAKREDEFEIFIETPENRLSGDVK